MTDSTAPATSDSSDRFSAVADVLVVFGITGDLARVMTFRSLYRLELRGLLDCPIVGVSVDDWTLEHLVQRARDSIVATGEALDEEVFARFAGRLSYVQGDFGDAATYQRVGEAISGAQHPVFYLEIPPFLFGRVVKGLAEAGLTTDARVVVEKPFGHDVESAQGSGGRAARVRRRGAAATGSTTTWGRWATRRSSTCASPTRSSNRCGTATTSSACRSRWPRTSASRIAVTSTTRSGALRDVVVNHLMQVVAATAMEPPSATGSEALHDAAVALFRSVKAADPAHYVRGQHDGYLEVKGVAADSTTETYAALRLEIDNPRWAGVPFYIRTGKLLAVTQTEVRVVFKEPPLLHLGLGAGENRQPARDEFVDQARSRDRRSADRRRPPRRWRRARGDHARRRVRRRGGRGPDALRSAAACGARRRLRSLQAAGRRRGELADHAAAHRQPTARAPLRPRLVGSGCGAALVADHGGWQGPWIVEPPKEATT